MRSRPFIRPTQQGVALLITVMVLTVLSLLLVTVTRQVRYDVYGADYVRKRLQAEQLAAAGINRVAAQLSPTGRLSVDENFKRIKGEQLGTWIIQPADWNCRVIPPGTDNADVTAALPAAGATYVRCAVSAEESKLPVNALTQAMWAGVPNVTHTLAEAIDKDRKAKGDYNPVLELLRVEGMTAERFLGGDGARPLDDTVTEFSRGKVYLYGADYDVLMVLPGMTPEAAREILLNVKAGKFELDAKTFLRNTLNVTTPMVTELDAWVTVQPSYYRVAATGVVGHVEHTLQAVILVGGEKTQIVWRQGY